MKKPDDLIVIEKLLAHIDDQNCEIERLKRAAQTNWNEFADGMKAQSSGVVLPEPMKRGDEGESGEYGAAMIRGYNACLREVARLNSSPVSADNADSKEVK